MMFLRGDIDRNSSLKLTGRLHRSHTTPRTRTNECLLGPNTVKTCFHTRELRGLLNDPTFTHSKAC